MKKIVVENTILGISMEIAEDAACYDELLMLVCLIEKAKGMRKHSDNAFYAGKDEDGKLRTAACDAENAVHQHCKKVEDLALIYNERLCALMQGHFSVKLAEDENYW